MRKLVVALLFTPALSFAQDTFPKLNGDTLYTSTGFKVVEGEKVKIGVGSTSDGDFKFIRRSSTSMFAYHSTTGYQGLANAANALPRNQAGLEYKIVRIDKRGTKKTGFVYYPIINIGMTRYEIDIENAITSGELNVPEEFKPKKESTAVVVQQEVSVADELVKMKKLYDDGVLTKEEYEAQKKKLLEKN